MRWQLRPAAPPILPTTKLPVAEAGELHVRLRTRHSPGGASQFHLDATFAAAAGVTVIVGHSGAGKTTILRCIAGLTHPQEGRISVGGRVLFDSSERITLEPSRRKVSFVFQDLALFPHLSVQDNVMYGLRRMDRSERHRRMREILESFQIPHLCDRSPRDISGGEQQRVALARSLVTEPSVLLLDEPMSSLDPATKLNIIEDIQRWNTTRGIPILYVTHDQAEVFALADRVIALEQGRIVAEGLPLDVVSGHSRAALSRPAPFENLYDATVVEHREAAGIMVCRLNGTSVQLAAPLGQASIGADVRVGVRAGDVLVSSAPPAVLSACTVLPGRIRTVERRGSTVEARVGCGADLLVRVDAPAADAFGLEVDSEVWMTIGPHACHVVPPVALDSLRRLFLFVCHGNTARSPMAQSICNAEIALRCGVPLESLDRLGIKAVSAGLTARPGEPLKAGAEHALGEIGLPLLEHRASNLSHRLVQRAEAIFCMTEEQRSEVIARFPAAQPKSYRLHPDEDIGDPHGTAVLEDFLDCALQIQVQVRSRLNYLGVSGEGA